MAFQLTENEKKLIDSVSIATYYNTFVTPINPKKFKPMQDLPGKGGSAVCPFHDENDPSFHDWKSKKIFRCFGCGATGNVIQFHQKLQRQYYGRSMSKEEAMIDLAKYFNIALDLDEKGDVVVESPFDIAKKKLLNPTQYKINASQMSVATFKTMNMQIISNTYLRTDRKINAYENLDIMLAMVLAKSKNNEVNEVNEDKGGKEGV